MDFMRDGKLTSLLLEKQRFLFERRLSEGGNVAEKITFQEVAMKNILHEKLILFGQG